MTKFFITHSWKDIEFARRLFNDLTARGLEGWLDDKTLQGGHRLAEEINKGLEWCDVYIPILSRAALESPWCWEEINAAITLANRRERRGRPRIIPVLIEECEVPPLLAARLYFNFANRYEDALNELLSKGFETPAATRETPAPVPRATFPRQVYAGMAAVLLVIVLAVVWLALQPNLIAPATMNTTSADRSLTATLVLSPTLTPRSTTVSDQPTLSITTPKSPALGGTAVPLPTITIAPDNADRIVELARWGKGIINQIAWSPDRKQFGVASSLGIYFYDVQTGQETRRIEPNNRVLSLAFAPDGQMLASGLADKTIKLWEVASGREVRTLSGHTDAVLSVAFTPDGRTLASGSQDKTIKLWDVASRREVQTLNGHTEAVLSIAFTPDGQMLASGSADKSIKLWEVASGREVRTLSGHTARVLNVAFAPDGQILASGSQDTTIKLWQVTSGRELRTLSGHMTQVLSVAFAPDGRMLASGSADKTVKLWDMASGREVRTLSGHTAQVSNVIFAPDGRLLISGSEDGTVRLWGIR